MCKRMMQQRVEIEAMLNDNLKQCLENIRQSGHSNLPNVLLDLENVFIANREYFEHQGFCFEPITRGENNQVKYYAWLGLGGEGELGRTFWNRLREAREDFMKEQRKEICDHLRAANGSYIIIDINQLLFEHKMFFEERGYCFEPDTIIQNGKMVHLAYMKRYC